MDSDALPIKRITKPRELRYCVDKNKISIVLCKTVDVLPGNVSTLVVNEGINDATEQYAQAEPAFNLEVI